MSPECLYWLALLALVLPSVPFNKTALVVLVTWAFGHTIHISNFVYEDAAYMFARIVAIGAALALSRPWDGSRRAFAQLTVALLFAPAALFSYYSALYFTHPPSNWPEYNQQTTVYWVTWGCIMAQALAVPFGNDWNAAKGAMDKFDDWAMRQIVKRFGQSL